MTASEEPIKALVDLARDSVHFSPARHPAVFSPSENAAGMVQYYMRVVGHVSSEQHLGLVSRYMEWYQADVPFTTTLTKALKDAGPGHTPDMYIGVTVNGMYF